MLPCLVCWCVLSTAAHLYHGAGCIVCIALALVGLVPGVGEGVATDGDCSNARVVEHLYGQGAVVEWNAISRALGYCGSRSGMIRYRASNGVGASERVNRPTCLWNDSCQVYEVDLLSHLNGTCCPGIIVVVHTFFSLHDLNSAYFKAKIPEKVIGTRERGCRHRSRSLQGQTEGQNSQQRESALLLRNRHTRGFQLAANALQ